MLLDCTFDRKYPFLKQIFIEYSMCPKRRAGETDSRIRKRHPVGVEQMRTHSASSLAKASHQEALFSLS